MKTPGAAALALALVAAIAAAGLAEDREKASGELKAGAEYAARGTIAEAPSPTAKLLVVSSGKVTVSIALGGRFALRVDKVVRAKDGAAAFPKGMRLAVLGKPSRLPDGPNRTFRCQVTPTVVVVGEGYDPYGAEMPPPNPSFTPEPKWFVGPIDRFEAPGSVWIGRAGDCQVALGGSGRALSTTVGDGSKLMETADLRRLLEKGQPVRFRGKVEAVAWFDMKGQPIPESARGKPGARAEARLVPKKLMFLDGGWSSYDTMEDAEDG